MSGPRKREQKVKKQEKKKITQSSQVQPLLLIRPKDENAERGCFYQFVAKGISFVTYTSTSSTWVSPDGTFIAFDQRIYNTKKRWEECRLEFSKVAFSPSSKWMAAASFNSVQIWKFDGRDFHLHFTWSDVHSPPT